MAKLSSSNIENRKNIIINGGMNVWQRSTSVAAIGNGDAGYHTVDRWRFAEADSPGAVITMSRDTDVPDNEGFGYSLQIDCTTAEAAVGAAELMLIGNRIEGQNVQHLCYGESGAKSLTVSFWLKSDTKTGTMCVSLQQDDASRGYVEEITIADNNWNKYTITIPGDASGTINNDTGEGLELTFTLFSGTDYHTTAGAWTAGASLFATSNQTNFLDNTANNIFITGVQLEVGEVATDFEFRSYGEELALCQRYYEQWGNSGAGSYTGYGNGLANSSTSALGAVRYVEKRVAPTVSKSGTLRVKRAGGGETVTAFVGAHISTKSCTIEITVASGLTAGDGMFWGAENDSAAYVTFDAEL